MLSCLATGFSFSFDIGEMFSNANMIIGGFMPLLAVAVGLAIGFKVVMFVKSLF